MAPCRHLRHELVQFETTHERLQSGTLIPFGVGKRHIFWNRIKIEKSLFSSKCNYHPQRSCEGYVFTGVCLSTGGSTWPGTPPAGAPHRTRYTPWQVHPPGPGTPPRQVHPWGQVHPKTRYTPRTRCAPQAGIPPRQVSLDQVHPLGRYTPPAGTPQTR